jgi:hypothetical protein
VRGDFLLADRTFAVLVEIFSGVDDSHVRRAGVGIYMHQAGEE